MAKNTQISYEKIDDGSIKQKIQITEDRANDLKISDILFEKKRLINLKALVEQNHQERIAAIDNDILAIDNLLGEAEKLGVSVSVEDPK